MSVITWITTLINTLGKAGPILTWLVKLFPQLDFVAKIMAIAAKISTDPTYPFVKVLQDVADIFSSAVTPVPSPPGSHMVGAPMLHEIYSSSDNAVAYRMLPTDIQQHAIDSCNKATSNDPVAIGSIPWPIITTIFNMFGPWAKQLIDLFLASWAVKHKAAAAAAAAASTQTQPTPP